MLHSPTPKKAPWNPMDPHLLGCLLIMYFTAKNTESKVVCFRIGALQKRRCEWADGAPPKSTVKCVVYETPVCSSIMFDISAINIYLAILIGYSFEYMNLWSLNVQRCIYLQAMLRSPTAELRQVAKVRELTTCQVVKAVLEQES